VTTTVHPLARGHLWWLAGAVTALLAVVSGASAQGPLFRAQTDLVSIGVTLTDRRNGFVADLAQSDFEVLEDGRPQSLTYFERGAVGARSGETHVGLLFDTSGSMGEDIVLARSAAVKFLNTLRDATDMTLVDFDTEVRVARYGQQDFPRLVERIRSRKPGGYTAMYDALGVYLDGAAENTGRTILVLFTDGGDTRSTIRFDDVVTLLRASVVTVFAIGFLDNQPSSVRSDQRFRLSRIAEETGGEAFFPRTIDDVGKAYDRIVAGIEAQYTLGYTSTNTKADGTWRKVEVRVRKADRGSDDRESADRGTLRLHTRKGYFAPYRK
jgi:Ca-activated chloride channel family protein